jgi:hypothetical protein
MKSGTKTKTESKERVLSPFLSSAELLALRSDNRLTPEPKHYIREWHHTSHPGRGRRRSATDSRQVQLGLEQKLLGHVEVQRRCRRSLDH